MKKTHIHHTKKKSAKNHSSKVKLRNFVSNGLKMKIHTRTKFAKAKRRFESLEVTALKLPDINCSTKEEIVQIMKENAACLPKKEIKLMLEIINNFPETELNEYLKKRIKLSELIKCLVNRKR